MKTVSPDLEQIRNVAIGAAGNLVFISSQKTNAEKFISIFQHYNFWFKNFETGEYRDSLQVRFPDLNWCEGYQNFLLDFASEPGREELAAVGPKCTRDEYLGEILWRKFQGLQTRLRNDFNPHWNPVVRSGVHGIAEEEANFSAMLKIIWDLKERKNHTQRISTHESRREVKNALNETAKAEVLEHFRLDSLSFLAAYPGFADWKLLEFHLFRLLGMGAKHRCLNAIKPPSRSTGPSLKTDAMSVTE